MPADKNPLILFKYGGNAMTNESLKTDVLRELGKLQDAGYRVAVVHGGGPFINEVLTLAKIESEFIGGHRKTSPEALKYVEMALKGQVNGNLIGLFNKMGYRAVGLSGKDGKMITAQKRFHREQQNGAWKEHDLGQVGDVLVVDTTLPDLLLSSGYIPVITCLAQDENGDSFNINADMFAGHLAGALQADQFIVMTDVDGLLQDIKKPDSLLQKLSRSDIQDLIKDGVIAGGMIPKTEACVTALDKGARAARIINGTKPDQIRTAVEQNKGGTLLIP